MVIVGVDPKPAKADEITKWCKEYYDDLKPHGMGGEERVKASYRDNYKRLVAIKNEYDPENFFRVNQNIKPQQQIEP